MNQTPQPPPGFVLQGQASGEPPQPPPGFKLVPVGADEEDEKIFRELTAQYMPPNRPFVPISGIAETPGEMIAALRRLVPIEKAKRREQQQFEAGRTPLRRAADVTGFAASAPVRMATKGEYGLGDIAGLVSPGAGRAITQSETGFARANEGTMELLQRLGSVAPGIPELSTLGAVGMPARATAIANRPLPSTAAARAGIRNERLADVAAFRQLGIEPFGPALTETGLAGTVKQLSEAPIVGAPVRNKLLETIEQTRDAGENIASQYGAARSYRDTGNIAIAGLERFKDMRGERAAGLSDQALAGLARTPARNLSIKTKQDVLYERAWRGIPETMRRGRAQRDVARFHGAMTNTQQLLRDLTERNQRMYSATRGNEAVDPALAYPLRGGVAGQIAADIIEGRWRGNLQTMRDVRSEFRRLASGISDTERNTLKLSDMRRIQSAMTEDMIALLQRNAGHYRQTKQPKIATEIERSIHDFRRADQFTRASAQRLEAIEKFYGAQSAEQLGLSILKDAQGGRRGGNLQRLRSLRKSLRNEEWGDIASGVLREMGRPPGGARGVTEEAGFSVASFITNWNNLSPEGRSVIFNQAGTRELGQALNHFVRVADRMANFEALANTSRSATNALGLTGLASILTAAQQAVAGNLSTAAAAASVAVGTYAFGRFMTSPAYVRWLTRTTELSGQPGALRMLRGQARELVRLAEKEPDLPVQRLLQAIAVGLDQQISGAETASQRRGIPAIAAPQ